MKFEKFFKMAGTHGEIVKRNEVESWLICEGVGMRIPDGINNLGAAIKANDVFNTIVHSEPDDDYLHLKEAVLLDPEGKAGDIIRVFETDLGDRAGIYNSRYGLLEKRDRLTYLEIEDDDPDHEGEILKYIVVRDHNDEVVGFINATSEI